MRLLTEKTIWVLGFMLLLLACGGGIARPEQVERYERIQESFRENADFGVMVYSSSDSAYQIFKDVRGLSLDQFIEKYQLKPEEVDPMLDQLNQSAERVESVKKGTMNLKKLEDRLNHDAEKVEESLNHLENGIQLKKINPVKDAKEKDVQVKIIIAGGDTIKGK